MMKKRFAVVLDWENSVSAEAECVRRFKCAAEILGLACDVVDTQYRCIDNRRIKVSKLTHDFVLHIHFFSGKAENVFSFATLWNPLDIYHNWGYRQSVDTLMTNDDFVSEGSDQVLCQIRRLTSGSSYHLLPDILMYPSPPRVEYTPTINQHRRLFYSGINWERLTGSEGRFHTLLKSLDSTGIIDIYGPKIFQGIRPWKGFSCYRGEIPFDGFSMMNYLRRSGIALVLSSTSHIADEIVTNRLFEALSAGVVIIADQNPIIRKIMGDTCLYIDTDSHNCVQQVLDHVDWLNTHPQEAVELASSSQEIFKNELSLCVCLDSFYSKVTNRKEQVIKSRIPSFNYSLNVFYICNDDGFGYEKNWDLIVKSISANNSTSIRNYLLTSKNIEEKNRHLFSKIFVNERQTSYGRCLYQAIKQSEKADFYAFVLPGEELFDNHFESIIKSIDSQNAQLGCSDIILKVIKPDAVTFQGLISLTYLKEYVSSGVFVFRSELLTELRLSALKQSHLCFIYALVVGNSVVAQSRGFTCKIHNKVLKMKKDIDVIKDLRFQDWFDMLTSEGPTGGVVKEISRENSILRKMYNKNYLRIAWIRRYPLVWNFCKNLIKPFM